MPLLLTTQRKPSEDHRVEPAETGFMLLPHPGREQQFRDLALRVVDYLGPFAAFPPQGT
jgi:hypothetical protein